MESEVVLPAEQARSQRKQNKRYVQKLRAKKPKKLDDIFHELHDEAFEYTDCLSCANCCKTISPVFTYMDIERIARSLKMRPAEFVETYLYLDEDSDYVLKQAPCPFLAPDNYCLIYEDRPKACRQYPHTNRKGMHKFLNLTLKNAEVCPAVYDIFERLKEELPL